MDQSLSMVGIWGIFFQNTFLGLTAHLYLTAFYNRPFHWSLYSHIKLIFSYFLL